MFGIGRRLAISLVECEIEVLYQILAWGILEKMKNNPRQVMPAKVQKAGLHTCALFVKSCPARPYTSPGACLCGRGRRRVPWPWACLATLDRYTINIIYTMLPWQHLHVQIVAHTTVIFITIKHIYLNIFTYFPLPYIMYARACAFPILSRAAPRFGTHLHTLYNYVQL